MRFHKTVWSPIEIEYLKANRAKLSDNQLSIALAKSRNAIKNKCAELDGKPVKKSIAKRSMIGRRKDLNQFTRSGWEANTLRWLKHEGKKYEYEPKVFPFLDIKHGTTSYCPDIWVPGDNTWIEIKGMLDAKSKTQMRRFKKYYPEEFKKLKVIVGSANTKAAKFFEELGVPVLAYYNNLNREYKNVIDNWE